MATKKDSGVDLGLVAGAVAAAAAAASAAAGAYWFYGASDAQLHRKAARSWMLRARADVLETVEKTVEKLGDIDKATYLAIVDEAVKKYSNVQGATEKELVSVARDLKAAWAHMNTARKNKLNPAPKAPVKKAKKKVAKR